MSAKLVATRKELEAKQAAAAKVFEEAGPDMDFEKVKCLGEGLDTKAKVEKLQEMNRELGDLGKEVEDLAQLVKMRDGITALGKDIEGKDMPSRPPQDHGDDRRVKRLGEIVTGSEAFKKFCESKSPAGCVVPDGGMKTLFQTTAGWAPESTRVPGLVIDAVTRPIQIIDIIPPGTTGQAAVVYMEETTRTHAAAERAENAAYAESAFALTERSSTVRSIGSSIPVTDEQLADVQGVQSYLDLRLTFGVRQRLDGQLLTGDGNAPNLTGLLNVSGIQTRAKGADPTPDAFYKAMTLVKVTGRAFPNAHIIHPNDWEPIRLLRTSDGIYVWGNPADVAPERMWGLRVVISDAITENTGLTGDFNFSQLYERQGMEVLVGYVNDDFLDGRRTIRAGVRVAFVTYRAAAFCTVTGI